MSIGNMALAALLGGVVGFTVNDKGQVVSIPEARVVDYLKTETPELIHEFSVDVSTARSNEEIPVAGSCLFVENPSTPTVPVYVRFNEKNSPLIDITSKKTINGVFYRLFVTNDVGTGVLNIKISRSNAFNFQDSVIEINITSSTVQVPIDIQGSYIQMPVDIQGQYVTLDIDIVAQTVGAIQMDIAAQSIGDIAITISGQISNLEIDVKAQSVAIKGLAEWGTVEGKSVNKGDGDSLSSQSGGYILAETVPTGKIWYVFQWSVVCYTSTENAPFRCTLEVPATVFVCHGGGEYGYSYSLARPFKAMAGQEIKVYVFNFKTSAATAYGTINVVELDA